MYNPSTNWVEQIKFIVREMLNGKQFVLEGVVSSVDPTPPGRVKVLLEPFGIESGWLRCATPYAGKNFGLVLPPPEEGTQVKVMFDMGDIKNGTVIGALYGDDSPVPNIAKGAAGLVHKSGSSLLILPDGTVQIKGKNNTQSW